MTAIVTGYGEYTEPDVPAVSPGTPETPPASTETPAETPTVPETPAETPTEPADGPAIIVMPEEPEF